MVEEKTGLIESQIASILYNASQRPALSGKTNPDGEPQFPTYGEIGADDIARVLPGASGSRSESAPAPREPPAHRIEPAADVLRRMSPQRLDPIAGRQHRARRHRLSRDGAVDA